MLEDKLSVLSHAKSAVVAVHVAVQISSCIALVLNLFLPYLVKYCN